MGKARRALARQRAFVHGVRCGVGDQSAHADLVAIHPPERSARGEAHLAAPETRGRRSVEDATSTSCGDGYGAKAQRRVDHAVGKATVVAAAVTVALPAAQAFDVKDLDAKVKEIEQNGGTIVVPKMPIPGVGYVAYFKDPDGNILSVVNR